MAWNDWFKKGNGDKDNVLKWLFRSSTVGKVMNLVSRWKDRGYKVGDIVGSIIGLRYDPNQQASLELGDAWNNVSGVSAAQNWQSSERLASQDYQTSERVAAQQFTHSENELARGWQERMSNTAIQRQMSDAQKAGINPIHVFAGSGQGAGVPVASGSSGTAAAGSAPGDPSSGNSAAAVASAVNTVGGIVGALIKAFA